MTRTTPRWQIRVRGHVLTFDTDANVFRLDGVEQTFYSRAAAEEYLAALAAPYMVTVGGVRYLTAAGLWTRYATRAGRWSHAEARRLARALGLVGGKWKVTVREAK